MLPLATAEKSQSPKTVMVARVMNLMGPARPFSQVAKVAARTGIGSIEEIVLRFCSNVAFSEQNCTGSSGVGAVACNRCIYVIRSTSSHSQMEFLVMVPSHATG